MIISYSKHTPHLANGEFVSFSKGDQVLYKDRTGKTVKIIIDSDLLIANKHAGPDAGQLSYDCIFTDTGERAGAIARRIIDWKGKIM